MKKIAQLPFLLLLLFSVSCEDTLEENVYSQLAPENFLTQEEGIRSVLYAAISEQEVIGNQGNVILHSEEWTTDLEWETGGGANRDATLFINYSWDASTGILFNMWQSQFRAIRDANVVLENIDNVDASDEVRQTYTAEARFIRALAYVHLYEWFGPVPIRSSTTQELEIPRASAEELESFIETELVQVIPVLPSPGTEAGYGRPTNGAARTLLAKFYLNTKQWQKAADMAQDVIDMGSYALYPNYEDLFKVENERNNEFIYIDAAIPSGPGNEHMNGAFPAGFAMDPRTGLAFQSSWRNWARQDRLLDGFYNSFDPSDKRKNLILSRYVNDHGDTVSLLNANNTRSFKFWPDPNGIGNDHGNDIPTLRYADILLTRAEALNELNGPRQEAIDLINQVRNRAGLEDLLLSDFTGKDALRDQILNERGWEFYSERKRRQDLIRMVQFIPSAHQRGVANADAHHRLFPIPQQAIDANSLLEQNPGY